MPNQRHLNSLAQLQTLAREHLVIAGFIVEHAELSYKQIAAELGVSRHTVMRLAKQARLTRKPGRKLGIRWPEYEKARNFLD